MLHKFLNFLNLSQSVKFGAEALQGLPEQDKAPEKSVETPISLHQKATQALERTVTKAEQLSKSLKDKAAATSDPDLKKRLTLLSQSLDGHIRTAKGATMLDDLLSEGQNLTAKTKEIAAKSQQPVGPSEAPSAQVVAAMKQLEQYDKAFDGEFAATTPEPTPSAPTGDSKTAKAVAALHQYEKDFDEAMKDKPAT